MGIFNGLDSDFIYLCNEQELNMLPSDVLPLTLISTYMHFLSASTNAISIILWDPL